MEKQQTKIKKVGITGASGNIGSTLQEGLCKDYELELYDINKPNLSPKSKFIKVDFTNKNEIDGIFNGLDALIHLAGNPHPNAPRHQTFQNNFLATLDRRAGVGDMAIRINGLVNLRLCQYRAEA